MFLLVDDDAHIRDVIAFALEKADMQVQHAADGREALRIFQQNTAIDLIVLDINMPEMDGLELCRELRKTSQTPILFLSSRDDEIDRILGLELGGDDYVTKSFSPRELVARIHAILKRIRPPPCILQKTSSCYGLKIN
jgi:two-component system OmpR family response regulator